LTQKGEIEVEQSWPHNGAFDNTFYSTFQALNKSDQVLAITKLSAEYFANGKWLPVESRICSRSGFYNYNRCDSNNFNMGALGQQEISVACNFKVARPHAERHRRGHHSLPQPMKLKITLTDSAEKTCTIMVEQENGALSVPTKQQKEKDYGGPFLFWIECDDTETETRVWSYAKLGENDTRMEVYVPGRGAYLDASELKKLGYKAAKQKLEEIPLEVQLEDKDSKVNVYGMVDSKNQRIYALKFVLNTATSSVTDYLLLPLLKQKE